MGGERESDSTSASSRPDSESSPTAGTELPAIQERVVVAVRRNCPSWMRSQVEDIAQNVLLKLHRSIEKSAGNRTFSAVYLEKAAHGAVVDEIRRVCRRREDALDGEQGVDRLAAESGDPYRRSRAREIAQGIFDCLDRLSRTRRIAVALYLNGCTVPEAASRLRWNLKRTESLVYRGLAQLRHCLAAKGLEP